MSLREEFPLKKWPILKRKTKNENVRVASLESVSIHLKKDYLSRALFSFSHKQHSNRISQTYGMTGFHPENIYMQVNYSLS